MKITETKNSKNSVPLTGVLTESGEIIVFYTPDSEEEAKVLPENQQHDCDQMGCGSCHILYRDELTQEQKMRWNCSPDSKEEIETIDNSDQGLGDEMLIKVMSAKDFKTYYPSPRSLAISIVDKTFKDDIKPFHLDKYASFLQIECDDKTTPKDGYLMFSEENAKQIFNFLNKNKYSGYEELVIHCYLGKSRSAAVALGIYFWLGSWKGNYSKLWTSFSVLKGFNKWILGTMIKIAPQIPYWDYANLINQALR